MYIRKAIAYSLLCSALALQSCFLWGNEDCPTRDFCDGNEFWEASGTAHLGCDDSFVEDCSETARVCLDGIWHKETGCYYENTPCAEGVESFCEGSTLVLCDREWSLGEEKIECEDMGLECVQFEGKIAGCTEPCAEDTDVCRTPTEELVFMEHDNYEEAWVSVGAEEGAVMQCMDKYWFVTPECILPDTDDDTATSSDTSSEDSDAEL